VPRSASHTLGVWVWVLLALIAGHDLTHALDDGLDTTLGQLALVSTPQWIVIAGVVAVFLRGDARRSHVAALLLGIGGAIGFVIVHLLPFALAPYWDLEPSFVSWLFAWVPIAVALYVAALAWSGLRQLDDGVAGADGAAGHDPRVHAA
jgi:hypothetical protein